MGCTVKFCVASANQNTSIDPVNVEKQIDIKDFSLNHKKNVLQKNCICLIMCFTSLFIYIFIFTLLFYEMRSLLLSSDNLLSIIVLYRQ